MTHITYKTAKRLKEFLGESAPEPMTHGYWCKGCGQIQPYGPCDGHDQYGAFPAYRLKDLLSKPFCEAMAKNKSPLEWNEKGIYETICNHNYKGGLPAVEAALMEMMK